MRGRGTRARAAVAALVVAAVALVAACGAESPKKEDPSSSNDSSSPNSSPASSSDPSESASVGDHAVDPPGPLKDRLWSADILVFATEPLTAEMIEQIKRVKGVAATEVMGLGQAAVQNRVLNVAAVDPATYRRFTPVSSAQSQVTWDRVAGGELAIDEALGKKLADEDGYLQLGVSQDAPSVHIGAYAPQIPSIEAVVNTTWTESLNLQFGNAVLVSTDSVSPAVVRPKIQKIVGDTASIQALDVVARLGLDPDVKQTAVFTGGSIADVVGTFNYRVLGDGRVAPDPSWVSAHISTRQMPIIGSMTCHNAVFPQLEAALEEIQGAGLADKIYPDQYAGCYYPRFIANSTTLSNHAFGLAFDINTAGNQRGVPGEIDRVVVAIFERWGFAWGGRWAWTDPMHFELSRIVEPR